MVRCGESQSFDELRISLSKIIAMHSLFRNSLLKGKAHNRNLKYCLKNSNFFLNNNTNEFCEYVFSNGS